MTYTLLDGRYELLTTLGRGGMSDVHLGLCHGPVGFGKLVVVKELRAELGHDADHVWMFMEEARLGARLSHPGIAHVHELGLDGHRLFIVMEYLDGQPMHRALMREAERGGLPLGVHLAIMLRVLEGLHYVHELADYDGAPLGIVHRDVSPQNVFLTYDGRVKLIDFGIAESRHRAAPARPGVVKGKASYMAPEQARGDTVDRRADVYSVGVMLWEAVTGARLFQEDRSSGASVRDLDAEVPSPRSVRPAVSGELERICFRALAEDPGVRYDTAEAFRRDLWSAVAALGIDTPNEEIGRTISDAFATERERFQRTLADKLRNRAEAEHSVEMRAGEGLESTPLGFGSSTGSHRRADPKEPRESQNSSEIPTVPPPGRRRKRRLFALCCASGLLVAAVGTALVSARYSGTPGGPGAAQKPVVVLSRDIDTDTVLSSSKDYLLEGNVFVRSGATLTMERGTTVRGNGEARAALFVEPNARLVAEGTPQEPILFTSERTPSGRCASDWGGIVLLGESREGRPERTDPDVLRYVRVECSRAGVSSPESARPVVLDHVDASPTRQGGAHLN